MDDVQGESSSKTEDDIPESVAQRVSRSVATSSFQSSIKKLSESSLCLSFFVLLCFMFLWLHFVKKGENFYIVRCLVLVKFV